MIVNNHAVSTGYNVCPEGDCLADTNTNPNMGECKDKDLTSAIFARSSSIVLNYKLEQS